MSSEIKHCLCEGKPRLSKKKIGIFNFCIIKCRCGKRTYGEYLWLSEKDRQACIKEWNEEINK
jgi:hypothetical protein